MPCQTSLPCIVMYATSPTLLGSACMLPAEKKHQSTSAGTLSIGVNTTVSFTAASSSWALMT